MAWIRKNLEGCDNPRVHGRGMSANRAGQWRYRVGDYRLIAEIEDEKIVNLIVNVGHHREIYIEKCLNKEITKFTHVVRCMKKHSK